MIIIDECCRESSASASETSLLQTRLSAAQLSWRLQEHLSDWSDQCRGQLCLPLQLIPSISTGELMWSEISWQCWTCFVTQITLATSTPKDVSDADSLKIQELKAKRWEIKILCFSNIWKLFLTSEQSWSRVCRVRRERSSGTTLSWSSSLRRSETFLWPVPSRWVPYPYHSHILQEYLHTHHPHLRAHMRVTKLELHRICFGHAALVSRHILSKQVWQRFQRTDSAAVLCSVLSKNELLDLNWKTIFYEEQKQLIGYFISTAEQKYFAQKIFQIVSVKDEGRKNTFS